MATNTPNSRFGSYYENAARNITNTATNITNTATNAANSLYKSANSAVNSIIPISSNTNKNSLFGLIPGNNNVKTNVTANSPSAYKWVWPIFIFMAIAIVTIVIIVMYKDKIIAGIHNINQRIRDAFNKPTSPPIDASGPPSSDVTDNPVPPQDEQSSKKAKSILDKIIPLGNFEVFNVSKNEFTYYDAEPLCRALGAQLATYDQVKDAWSKGADWCNYGWVKGQSAVYPIQEETFEKVQSGPDEDRNSCGTTGLNGGYFDNPELKFGVNCYGIKPPQSDYDEEVMMKQGDIPRTVPSLAFDRKVQEFKKRTDELGLLPFNSDKWNTI